MRAKIGTRALSRTSIMIGKLPPFRAHGRKRLKVRRPEELEQFSPKLLRLLFLEKMATIESPSAHRRGGLLAPGGENIPHPSDCSSSAPQNVKRTFDFPDGGFVGLVHFQVDLRTGPEVLAS